MTAEIKHINGKTLYVAKDATTVQAAAEEAVSAGAYLAGAYLAGAYLAGAYLARAYLTGAYLTGAYLAGAYLAGANLTGADLAGANLTGAYLARANLTGANLTRANLAGANLARAYLAGANLAGADLTGANLAAGQWENVAVTLGAAIEAMNDSGRHWIKGTLTRALDDGSRAYCSIGSIDAQEKRADGTTRTLALWLLGSVCAGDIAAFNDHPATTWDDVRAVFAVAIRHAERLAAS